MTHTDPSWKRLATAPLAVLGVLAMLAEEYLWHALVAFGRWLGNLPALRGLDAKIRALSPTAAAAALFTPAILIFPVKLLAVYAVAQGHVGWGLLVLISAKVVGTALVAHIYTLCQPALMTVAWFVKVRGWVLKAKYWAHRKLESWPIYRLMRRLVNRLRRVALRLLRGAQEPG